MFSKILIANRGEIACRIIQTAHRMGIRCVAVYSDADANARHVALADEAFHIGPAPSSESYLRSDKIIDIAKQSGAQAIHPGYGFLSENTEFAEACEANGLVFIGPPSPAIAAMGSKSAAKAIMEKAGVPLVPGYHGKDQSPEVLRAEAEKCGFPLLLKAVAGGGGKGMRVVERMDDFDEALAAAQREARNAFGNPDMLIERYLTQPRHVEIQVFCDQHGNGIYLAERDCSVQRRHQKVLEEAPSPVIDSETRSRMGGIVSKAMADFGYCGAGTIEFLYEDGEFYFIEMNTRLQVEHPVTEMITGIDIVREQIRVASGEKLSYSQDMVRFFGHAIECRINAEHPFTFMPSPGNVTQYHVPGGLNVRCDSAVYAGYKIPPYYDSMVAKLIVSGYTREGCLLRLRRSLEEYVIDGVVTTIPLHQALMDDAEFRAGAYDIHWLEKFLEKRKGE